ncbi:MAG: single-stranded-DNA-specific exonuclease RecJ [Bacteroidota bacterium]|nr:single-stranded-DNA-specific exonuclease RecJ [Bacteroidota bacterium]
MEKNWKIKEQGDPAVIEYLSEVLGIDKVLATLLVQRGISTYDEAKAFFRPELSHLHDPFLMKDMDKAIDRIGLALAQNEKILVYGDYDVDGTTAVALVYSVLKKHTSNIAYYVPDRYHEGYGISFKGIDYAKSNGFTLIISLDCGIKAVEKIDYAKNRGIDFIVCDHHYPGETIPDAVAVLDPKRPNCNYPYKELSGCGVGYKLLQGFYRKNNLPTEELEAYLDLVAVSIASDIVPINGENRILSYFGLKQLSTNPGAGLKSVIKIAGLENKEITVDDIVFKIGPRINAAGRVETGDKAVALLVVRDELNATSMGDKINAFNNTRKSIDNTITAEALKLIASSPEMKNRYSTVLYNPSWHKGVIGIVASRLIESYYRPTVILTESNGMATGSARSVEGFDLYQAIDACSDLLENFGGHMFAAGVTLKTQNVPAFKQRFEDYVAQHITEEQLSPTIEIDAQLELRDINPKFYRILKQFQPFGPANMSPVFLTKNVVDNGCGRVVGTSGEHLKLELIQEAEPFHVYQAIGFQMAKYFEDTKNGNAFDICYSIDENEFRGNTSLQIRIKDIK